MTLDGIYRKYNVTRTDGRDAPGQKHHACVYYVLDIMHDKYAAAALRAYALACEAELPELAKDVRDMADVCDNEHGVDVRGSGGYFPPPCYGVVLKVKPPEPTATPELNRLYSMLRRLEWSGTAYGFMDATCPRCPVCLGLKTGATLYQGGGSRTEGKGHTAECEVGKLLAVVEASK